MNKLAPMLILVGAVACGGGGGKPIGDKGQAADATYNLVTAKQGLEGSTSSGLLPAQAAGADVEGEITVRGQEGSATISASTQVEEGHVRVRYRVVYDGYSPDGINTYDGELTYLTEVRSEGTSQSVIEEVKGSARVSGEYAASLDIDVRMAIVVGAGSVSITIEGSIDADGVVFSYDGEVVGISSNGEIDIDTDPNDPQDPMDPVDPAACRGTYRGTYTGTDSGVVEGVLSDGSFRVTFTSDLGSIVDLVYSVSGEGAIGGTSFGIAVDASVAADPCRIDGTWATSTGGGTWEARIQ